MEHLKFGPSLSILEREGMSEIILCLMIFVCLVYLLRKR